MSRGVRASLSRGAVVTAVIAALAGCAVNRPGGGGGVTHDVVAIARVLDDFHEAAAEADFDRYFGHFTPDAVFLGTDGGERWTRAEFEAYAKQRFDSGGGWTYHPRERHVAIDAGGTIGWFDELLRNDKYGLCRGTGVVVRGDEGWKIAQYSLTFVVPNDAARSVVDTIRRAAGE